MKVQVFYDGLNPTVVITDLRGGRVEFNMSAPDAEAFARKLRAAWDKHS